MSERVLCDVDGGVAKIVLNRPEVGNAIDDALAAALIAAVDRVAEDPGVRAVLLTGAGRMFCAGGDIGMMKTAGPELGEVMERAVGPIGAAVLKLASLPVPVVSALNGPVGGGGVGLALCADLVLAGESMRLRGGYWGSPSRPISAPRSSSPPAPARGGRRSSCSSTGRSPRVNAWSGGS